MFSLSHEYPNWKYFEMLLKENTDLFFSINDATQYVYNVTLRNTVMRILVIDFVWFRTEISMKCTLSGVLLIHLSGKLQWILRWSPDVRLSALLSVNVSYFHFLLQNHWANSAKIETKDSLVDDRWGLTFAQTEGRAR